MNFNSFTSHIKKLQANKDNVSCENQQSKYVLNCFSAAKFIKICDTPNTKNLIDVMRLCFTTKKQHLVAINRCSYKIKEHFKVFFF